MKIFIIQFSAVFKVIKGKVSTKLWAKTHMKLKFNGLNIVYSWQAGNCTTSSWKLSFVNFPFHYLVNPNSKLSCYVKQEKIFLRKFECGPRTKWNINGAFQPDTIFAIKLTIFGTLINFWWRFPQKNSFPEFIFSS